MTLKSNDEFFETWSQGKITFSFGFWETNDAYSGIFEDSFNWFLKEKLDREIDLVILQSSRNKFDF